MHHTFVVSGLVDGAVAHKQAHARMVDPRHPEDSIVHMHRHGVVVCNKHCTIYHKGHSHPVDENCPEEENVNDKGNA